MRHGLIRVLGSESRSETGSGPSHCVFPRFCLSLAAVVQISCPDQARMNPISSTQCVQPYKTDHATPKSAKRGGNNSHEACGRFAPTQSEFKKNFFKWKLSRATQQKGGRHNDVGWYSSLVSEWNTLHWTGNAVIPSYAACRQWLVRDAALYASVQREMSQIDPTCSVHAGTPQLQRARVSDINESTLETGNASQSIFELKQVNCVLLDSVSSRKCRRSLIIL